MKALPSSRIVRWILALVISVVASLALSQAPAAALTTPAVAPAVAASTTCPLYYASAGSQTPHFVDSYGTWSDPSVSWKIKQGGTTCGTHVYTSHLIGQFDQYVYMRVWYNGGNFSHNPVFVHMVTSVNNYDITLVDLGTVPTGYSYRIEILSLSNTVGVASAGCLSYTCFYRERG